MRSSLVWPLLLLLISLTVGEARAAPRRIIALELQRDFSIKKTMDRDIRQALHQALRAADFEIIDPREAARHFKPRDPCVSIPCLERAARQLEAHYVVGGRISREADPSPGSWTVALWLFDARARATVATAQRGCERCGFPQVLAAIQPALTQLLSEAQGDAPARLTINSRPPGASVSINGRPVGVTDMSFVVTPGSQVVVLEHPGHHTHNVTVEVPPGEEITINAELKATRPALAPTPEEPAPDRSRFYGRLKWALAGGAVAALPVGVIFIAMGQADETQDDRHREEATVENYTPAGIALTAVGATLAAGALVSLLLERRARRAPPIEPRVEASAAGFSLGLEGHF